MDLELYKISNWQLDFYFLSLLLLLLLFFVTRYFHGILPDRNSPLGHTTHAHMAQVNQGREIKHETLGRKFKSCANNPTPLAIRLENIELHENQITILSVRRTPRNTKQLRQLNKRKKTLYDDQIEW